MKSVLKSNFLFLIFFFIIGSHFANAKDFSSLKFIDINNPFKNRIPIAVPQFIPVEESEEINDIAKLTGKYLKDLLKFTSYFEVMDDPPKLKGVVSTRIDFNKWKLFDTELLVTSGIYYDGHVLEMEFRLFDVVNQELITGKRYKGRKEDHNKMVKRFASEVMYKLFKNKGLFDSKLAFVSDTTGSKEVYLCDFDGSNIKRFTDDKSIAISPSWSYDNRWLAFTSYKRKIPEIFVKSLKNKKGYIISKGRLNITPAWMPGKFSLAAVFTLNGNPDIFFVSGKGEILKEAVKGWGIDVSPAFSPNGKKMLFVSRRGGTPQIYVKFLDTGEVSRLTFEGNYNTSPAWSPKGGLIAYVGMTKGGGINIYTIKPDGSDLRQLTSLSGDNEDPSWSPDGSLLSFSSTRTGKKRIHIMTRSGDDQRLLIRNLAGNQTDPAWSH